MLRKATMIPDAAQQMPSGKRPLRVAAYCRVSTHHEEQYHSLEAQIAYCTNYIKRNPNREFVAVYSGPASGLHAPNRLGYRKPKCGGLLCTGNSYT